MYQFKNYSATKVQSTTSLTKTQTFSSSEKSLMLKQKKATSLEAMQKVFESDFLISSFLGFGLIRGRWDTDVHVECVDFISIKVTRKSN